MVGIVGAPHGVRGEVRIKSFTARPEDIAGYGPLTSEDGRLRLVVTSARPLKDDMLVARLQGVATREAAAALTGVRLTIDRAALPQAEEEEFYHADLIGLEVRSEAGALLGRIVAVQNFGGGDILEIAGAGRDTLLVAFTRAFVPEIDLAEGRVTVADIALAEDPAGEAP